MGILWNLIENIRGVLLLEVLIQIADQAYSCPPFGSGTDCLRGWTTVWCCLIKLQQSYNNYDSYEDSQNNNTVDCRVWNTIRLRTATMPSVLNKLCSYYISMSSWGHHEDSQTCLTLKTVHGVGSFDPTSRAWQRSVYLYDFNFKKQTIHHHYE